MVHSWPCSVTVYINDLLTVPELCQTIVNYGQTACYVADSKLYLKFKSNELCNVVSAINPDLNEICLGGAVTIHCL